MIDVQRQEAIRKFVEEEVFACQSSLVEEALRKGFFSLDDVENLYPQFEVVSDAPDICERCGSISDLSEAGLCKYCYKNGEEPHEIYEWWVVSQFLVIKLRQHGEPILNNEYGTWWGRCTTGQAILLDGVIEAIYDEIMR